MAEGKGVKQEQVRYVVCDSLRQMYNNLTAVAGNQIQGAQMQMGIPAGYIYNPQTGEFELPIEQKEK